MSSKLRLALAGLTAAALIGGVMVADPADAGKKKHKKVKVVKKKKVKKGNSVKQVSKGGKAKAGHGGHGGNGGNTGNVYNTGNVGGGATVTPAQASCAETALGAFIGQNPTGDAVLDALVPTCFPSRNLAANTLQGCIQSAGTLTADEIDDCVGDIPVTPTPSDGGGSVFSGDGGGGAGGGTGGNATGGAGGNNSNSSSTTVNSNDHSIDVG
jgi:hypothetical protein